MPTSGKLDPRRELVYRLAIGGLGDRCRGDRAFKDRTSSLMLKFGSELDAVLQEARELERSLTDQAGKETPRR